MAEGQTRLHQQVVDCGSWTDFGPVSPLANEPCIDGGEQQERRDDAATVRCLVEAEVIARLASGHPGFPNAGRAKSTLGTEEVTRFARMLLRDDDGVLAASEVEALLGRGIPIEAVFLDLFEPAARHVGELWCEDLCTFVEATLAVGTMQRLVWRLGSAFHAQGGEADGRRRALLMPLPGEQHTFGLSVVSEFFRRAGWTVWSEPVASLGALERLLGGTWFHVVGFSLSGEDQLEELAAIIRRVRRESRNAGIGILVGGPLFVAHPEHCVRVGADSVAVDAVQALARAEPYADRMVGP